MAQDLQPTQIKPEAQERPPWVLSRDEQRLLWITFAGGLASIIAGACIIGISLAYARWFRQTHAPLSQMATSTVEFGVLTGTMLLASRKISRGITRWKLEMQSGMPRWLLPVFEVLTLALRFFWALAVLTACGGAAVVVLVLVGLAAGIH